jgi:hypothetical protein
MIVQPASPFYLPRRWEAVCFGLVAFVAYLTLSHFIGEARGTIGGAFIGSLLFTMRMSWGLRKELWFGLAMVLLAALHIAAFLAFGWSSAASWTGLTLIPFMMADLGLILGTIYLAYRRIYGSPAQIFGSPDARYAEQVD